MMDLTHNEFLGGAVTAWQPAKGYRAGVDAVLLAAAVPAQAGQSVLELGCGVGVAALCVKARVPQVDIWGLEKEAVYAELAAKNGLDVINGDLADMPAELRERSFDHVMFNPPYFDRTRGAQSGADIKEAARGEQTPLSAWIDAATRRLKPKGMLTLIHDGPRLPDVMAALDDRLGRITVQPFAPRIDRPAHLFIVQAVKSSRAPFTMLAPMILHEGNQHNGDAESYTQKTKGILRHGDPLVLNR